MSVRTGNTPTPDGSWSGFTPIASSGGDVPRQLALHPVPRRAEHERLRTTRRASSDVSIGYTAGRGHDAPTIVQRSPAPDATGVDPGTRRARSSSASRWTRARSTPRASACAPQGAGSDVPASVSYSGTTATLNPNADLAPGTVYHVTVAGSVEDANGNALGRRRHLELHDPAGLRSPTPPPPTSAPGPPAPTPTSPRPATARSP